MSKADSIQLENLEVSMAKPTCLFEDGGYAVYWLGIADETAFRCNVYLVKDGDQGVIIDPGSRAWFSQVKERVEQIMPAENICAMVLCHQDPDVAASLPDWMGVRPDILVISSMRARVLLPHYGREDFQFQDISKERQFSFDSGRSLSFMEAPFLHSPAAFVTFDRTSGYLFSGDIWAALTTDWELCVQNFDEHCSNMDMFHMDYMASNIATRGFVEQLDALPASDISAILPQHGSIIPKEMVSQAMEYLRTLQCGTDLLYPELSR